MLYNKYFIKCSMYFCFFCLCQIPFDFFSSLSWPFFFQTPAAPVMDGLVSFHQKAMLLVSFIIGFVGYFLFRTVFFFSGVSHVTHYTVHNALVEIFWTVFPAALLLVLAVPSFSLLFSIDELPNPQASLKCIGHQWFWCYEYQDQAGFGGFGEKCSRLPGGPRFGEQRFGLQNLHELCAGDPCFEAFKKCGLPVPVGFPK